MKPLEKTVAALLLLAGASVAGFLYSTKKHATAGPASAPHASPVPPHATEAAPLTEPATAAESHSAEPPPPPEDSWAKELRELKELAASNPDAAIARVARMRDKHEKRAAARRVCLVVAETDPAKAMTAAWDLGIGVFADDSSENLALENLATRWAEVDLVKAFAWVSAQPDDDEGRRDHIVKGIASAMAQVAPEEAARIVATRIKPDSSVQIEAMMQVLHHWAAQDYSAAHAWTSRFPEGPFRERGLAELARLRETQAAPAAR